MNILFCIKGQAENFSVDKSEKQFNFTKFYKLSYHQVKNFKIMVNKTNELIDTLYEKENSIQSDNNSK